MSTADKVRRYGEIILDAINRVVELHDANDPYWRAVIEGLKKDYDLYRREMLGLGADDKIDFIIINFLRMLGWIE